MSWVESHYVYTKEHEIHSKYHALTMTGVFFPDDSTDPNANRNLKCFWNSYTIDVSESRIWQCLQPDSTLFHLAAASNYSWDLVYLF